MTTSACIIIFDDMTSIQISQQLFISQLLFAYLHQGVLHPLPSGLAAIVLAAPIQRVEHGPLVLKHHIGVVLVVVHHQLALVIQLLPA